MPYIVHTSTGADNTPKLLEVNPKLIGIPQNALILYTDENGWDTTSQPGKIMGMANQAINPAYPEVTGLSWTGYDPFGDKRYYPVFAGTLNDLPVVKFEQGYKASTFQSTRGAYKTPTILRGGAAIQGTTTAALVAVSKSLFNNGGSAREKGNPATPIADITSATYNRCIIAPGTASVSGWTTNWGLQDVPGVSNFDQVPTSTIGAIEDTWALVMLVSDDTDSTCKLYVNGTLRYTWEDVAGSINGSTNIDLTFMNKKTSPVSNTFCGWFANAAAWLRALSPAEVSMYWEFIKAKYGLT